MKIIAHKNSLYNSLSFHNSILTNNNIDGVALDVIMTKDNKIISFNPIPNNQETIQNLQNSTLGAIHNSEVILLDEILNLYSKSNKMIMINIIPLSEKANTLEALQQVNKIAMDYVAEIKNIIVKYPNLNLYIYSISKRIVHFLKNIVNQFKIGIYIMPDDLAYIDTDFYVFSPDLLNIPIMKQQINMNKEIMSTALNCDGIESVLNFFEKATPADDKVQVYKNISFITNYPAILYRSLNYKK